MKIRNEHHPYRDTGKFSSLVLDYLDDTPSLRPFHNGLPSLENVKAALERRRSFQTDRIRLVEALREQYQLLGNQNRSDRQIDTLLSESTFTITTAHQCNIFLGPLYIVFKAMHTIRIADELNSMLPGHHFVPVFYVGSEDADLDELNHIHLLEEKLVWHTKQEGAVGRMLVDDELLELIERQEKLIENFPHGAQWIERIRKAYLKGTTMAMATFRMLHEMFALRGLLVLQPDRSSLKSSMKELFWNELTTERSIKDVAISSESLRALGYSPQAYARSINLFYLQEGSRRRIERSDEEWVVVDGQTKWDQTQLRAELDAHPERFSPNVILRGLYQETILPNILYVGGGGELAYWLQLRSVFESAQVPFPLLQLRASIQWMDSSSATRLDSLKLHLSDLFKMVDSYLNEKIRAEGDGLFDLSRVSGELADRYAELARQAVTVDPTLGPHVESLRVRALKKIEELEKKMMRAERRKLLALRNQIESLQRSLFPGNGLQERWENVGYYYALYGEAYLQAVYEAINAFDGQFTWLIETD